MVGGFQSKAICWHWETKKMATMLWIETHQPWATFLIHKSLTTTVIQIVWLSKSTLSPAVCSRNVAINIKVTIVRQTIKLNPLYALSMMINIFHDIIWYLWILLSWELIRSPLCHQHQRMSPTRHYWGPLYVHLFEQGFHQIIWNNLQSWQQLSGQLSNGFHFHLVFLSSHTSLSRL